MSLGRNAKRSKARFGRNFGERGGAVREMDCLARVGMGRAISRCWTVADCLAADSGFSPCLGDVQACHVVARGMGGVKGDRRQLVPLCARHHAEAGEGSWKDQQPSKRTAFESRYNLSLKAEAERIANDLDAQGYA